MIFGHFGPYCLVAFGKYSFIFSRVLKQIQEDVGAFGNFWVGDFFAKVFANFG